MQKGHKNYKKVTDLQRPMRYQVPSTMTVTAKIPLNYYNFSMLRRPPTINISPVYQSEHGDLDKINRCDCMPMDTDSTSRTNSSDSTMCWNLKESATSLLGECNKRLRSSIRFGKVQIRDYERIVSDNLAVRSGVPIG
jgi:hypothetical protein